MMSQMKSIRVTLSWMMLLACLCYSLPMQAQSKEPTAEDRPFIDVLSIDPLSGLITITWDMPETHDPSRIDPDKFVLYWYEVTSGGPTYPAFDTVSSSLRTKTYNYDDLVLKFPNMPDPRKTSVPLTVAALQGKPPNEISTLRAIPHHNIQVNSKYDSCRAEISLNWHRYRIWQKNTRPFKELKGYSVMRIPEAGGPHEEIKTLHESDTSYVISGVKENDKYTFYIKAIRDDLVETTSFRTIRETKMPIPPKFVTAVGTEYNSDGVAEVSFKIDPSAETYDYEFLGSSNYNYSFVSLGTLNIHSDVVLNDIQTRERTYYYKLEAWHICKNRYTANSNMATALWLTLKQEGPVNLLFWEPYVDWGGDARYDVYRKIGDHSEEIIDTVTDPETTDYKDNLSDVYIDGDICYWVIAKPVSPNLPGQQEHAFSNSVCIKPESNIFIPQAFTPNVAGINSEFKPFFSYPPEEYLFVIYDRTGMKQFEIKDDSDIGWNGQLLNGKPASEGVYVYYIRFRTAMGRLVEKRGTFSLILP